MSRRLTSLELVGREVELDALLRSYRRAGRGESGIVTIAGDAGIGKSRLIEAFAHAATADGARALRGGCVEVGGDRVVFAPVVEALRALIDEIGVGGLVEAAGHSCRAIARLIPDLPGPEPDAGGWSPDEGDLFEELFALVRRLSANRTLVVVFEDLHWADRSTRELIRFLARNLRTERILLVLSYRSDDLHRRHPLIPLLGELDRLLLTERITLSPLTRDEVALLAERILDARPEATIVDSLLERSDGNPFYVEELLAHHDEGAVPTPVRAIVVARAAGLSDATQALLRIASLIGRRPTHALLAQLSELPSARLTAAVRESVDAAFLRAEPDGRYAFRHELVREALYDDLLPSERTELHGRLAALIAASAIPNDAEAAFHWGLAHETDRALAATVRAADAALERLAFGEAMTLLLPLELWPGVSDAAMITGVTRSALLSARPRQPQAPATRERRSGLAGRRRPRSTPTPSRIDGLRSPIASPGTSGMTAMPLPQARPCTTRVGALAPEAPAFAPRSWRASPSSSGPPASTTRCATWPLRQSRYRQRTTTWRFGVERSRSTGHHWRRWVT